ncbi:MAG: curli assembly protein CsgG [Leptospiraceae bacterium]|nr:curli assembly protein CsgG [Leptospiraceae bacterium]MBK7056707.1 curli assembly protein CsgG [Leptospiraceae bacterium]MBK9498301.1 curli assembly protein CsgG [Leptospiraceae bacterium]MBL0262971.1 curli assembly protein CsgG [Leptospiraceae bacterium]MBP9164295.1 curli assembly protein CsgG [Leptospiraceae bacterium]
MYLIKLLISFFLFQLLIGCSSIDVAVTANKTLLKSMKKVAVMNFEMSNKDPKEQEFADIIAHQFLKSTKLNVIERDKLVISKVIGEQSLSRTGIIDESTAAQMGKILGVDAIVIGKGEQLMIENKSIEYCLNSFNIKVISVETGNIFVNVIKEPGIDWTPWIRLKFAIGGFGLVWSKNDLLLETCRINFLAEHAVKEIQSEMDKVNNRP